MTISEQLFQQASTLIPGGVNSPVRAFKGVGGNPVFFKRGEGPYLFDVDDRRYIDYVGSWGPLILGHAHPDVLAALRAQMENGLSYGAPTELEVQMAAQINALMPSIEMVRMVNSGTEATMSAIRLARAFAGRDKIVKFEGCYHGHADSLLVKAGSGALTLGEPSSPGVPASVVGDTITLPYNDIDALRECFEQQADSIGCVIVEPVAGNMNLILPESGFLEAMRELCSQHGSVLIFDEVMTGFRVARGGAQERFNIKPDLTCLGKVIGGGMPVGAFGGRRDIMERLAPSGPVYQAGTLSGNPMAMAAGLATLKALSAPGFYDQVSAAATRFTDGVKDAARRHGIPLCTATAGSMFGIFFSDRDKVSSFAEATTCDINRFQRFYHAMLNEGVYLAPSAYEAGFISAAHDNAVVDASIEAADRAMAAIA